LERIRRHGNFIETVPFVLILMVLAEAQNIAPLFIYIAGGLLTIGRILHPLGLKANNSQHPLRIIGNMGGLLATLLLTVMLALKLFGM
jgi:uncharacterized protein